MSESATPPEERVGAPATVSTSISGGRVGRVINIAQAGVVQLPPEVAVSPTERQQQRNRERMLERVRQFWVTGLLEESLQGATLQALGLESRPDAVPDPWQGTEARSATSLGSIDHVFDDADGQLLILGEPGGGKTTTLLELARVLLDRAEFDPDLPIPVVFPLAPWATRRLRLADWLVDELTKRYGVPVKIAQEWIDEDRVLPLLDGLDEVVAEHRPSCVAAVNTFMRTRTHDLLGLVVTCRVGDYQRLPIQLQLRRAVLLQALRDDQIDAYLTSAGDQLAGVRDALHADATLRELAATPVLLHAMTVAYRGVEAESLPQSGSIEQRRRQLFSTYIDAMFNRPVAADRFTRDTTMRCLGWLARALARQGQTVVYLDYLQPDWLSERIHRAWYSAVDRLGGGLLIGLAFGLLGALTFGLDFALVGRGGGSGSPGARPLGALAVGIDQGLAVGLAAGLVGALFGGLPRPASDRDRTWRTVRGAILGCLVVGLGSGLIFRLQLEANASPEDPLRPGLLSGIGAWLFFGLMGALAGVLTSPNPEIVDEGAAPGRPWFAVPFGALLGIAGGLVHGLLYWVILLAMGAIEPGSDAGVRFAGALALIAGLVGGLFALIGAGPPWRGLDMRRMLERGVRGWLITGLTCGLVAAICFGLVSALAQAFGPGFRVQPELGGGLGSGRGGGLGTGAGSGLASGLGSGLLFGLMGALAGGLSSGLAQGLAGRGRRIGVIDAVGWSTTAALRSAISGLLAGCLLGAVVGLVFPLSDRVVVGPGGSRGIGLVGVPNNIPLFALIFGLAGALAFGFTGGLAGRELESRIVPNQGIHRSARAAIVVGIASSVLFSLIGGLAFAGSDRLAFGLLLGPALGLPAGLSLGGYACMSHAALRLVLWRTGALPLDAIGFLDAASERIFLRRVGGGYIFVHRLLQEHFAGTTAH